MAFTPVTERAMINMDGFYQAPGEEAMIALHPTIINTTERAIKNFDIERRDCYSMGEFELKYLDRHRGFRYSMFNCLYQAFMDKVMSNCSCIPTLILTLHKNHDLALCSGANLGCEKYWIDMIGNKDDDDDGTDLTKAKDKSDVVRDCRMRCEDQSEEMTATTTKYPNRNTIVYREDFCLVVKKVVKACSHPQKRELLEAYYEDTSVCELVESNHNAGVCKDTFKPPLRKDADPKLDEFVEKYAEDNFAVIKAFIKNPYYTSIRRDQAMTTISFIANSGGLAGLCMGMSFVSIFEVIYHFCTLRCCYKVGKQRPRRRSSDVAAKT